jgi:hypothetical protein
MSLRVPPEHGGFAQATLNEMATLRPELRTIVDGLVVSSRGSNEVSLDTLGEAIGARSVSYDEIDGMIATLEARGRRVVAATDGRSEERLRAVVRAARILTTELGRRPSVAEIALRAGLSGPQVRSALMLARVMQR